MFSLRAAVLVGIAAIVSITCRSPGEGGTEPASGKPDVSEVTLPGIDTSDLTSREKAEWSRYVTEFLSPCAEHPVNLSQCVMESRACKACVPAARYLKAQARFGRVRAQVEASYRSRFSPEAVRKLDLGDSPSKGPSGAPVVIVEWADFECPACEAANLALEELLKKHPNHLRLVFKHFPLSMHPNAEKAARAAVAAQKQGKFWELHRVLFQNQAALSPDNVEKLARETGLDMKRFAQDRDSEMTADSVAHDRKQGETLEIKSTPSLFINGRQFPPTTEFKVDLEEWVKLEIELTTSAQAPLPPASPLPSAGAVPSPAPSAPTP